MQGASFGPTLTPYGTVAVRIEPDADGARVVIDAQWRGSAPNMDFNFPGYTVADPAASDGREFRLMRTSDAGKMSVESAPGRPAHH